MPYNILVWASDSSPHPRSTCFSRSHPEIIRDVRAHCLASLVFLSWDTLLTFSDEVEHIWPFPWKSKIKWLYLYLRYINLAALMSFACTIWYLTSGLAPESTCRFWFLFGIINSQLANTSLEVILALRAYVLWNRSRAVALFLWVLLGGELVGMFVGGLSVIPRISFETICVMVYLPKTTLLYGILVPMTQTMLVGMIVFKSILAVRAGWGRTPLVSLLVREGIAVYLGMLGLFICAMAASKQRDERSILLVFWYMAIMSTCGCRLIINMQRLATKRSDERYFESRIAFTTQIEMSTPRSQARSH